MNNALREMLTGPDNVTHDIVRWIAALGSCNAFVLAAYDVVVQHAHFDIQAYGIGFGALMAGLGSAIWLKKDSEPKP